MPDYSIDFSEYVEYDESSPSCLIWKRRNRFDFVKEKDCKRFNSVWVGKCAGGISTGDCSDYKFWCLSLFSMRYVNSKVIYILHNGLISNDMQVDHIDTNPLNNKILNLRISTPSQNSANTKRHKDNKSGYKGVYLDKRTGRWVATINKKYIGEFDTPQEASEAYGNLAKNVYGEFARVR